MSRIQMYDLAGADDSQRISPFCWRIRMALAHKGLPVETIPWRMVEKERIASSGSATVPVLVDRGKMIGDSWRIAEYLDATYPTCPLFDSPQAHAYCQLIHHWTTRTLHELIVPIILEDVLAVLDPGDLAYFRTTREKSYGKPLEDIFDRSPEAYARLRRALGPVRNVLRSLPFLGGEKPAFADYIIFGAIQWARCCSTQKLLPDPSDPMVHWFERLLDLYGGLARKAKTAGDELHSQVGRSS